MRMLFEHRLRIKESIFADVSAIGGICEDTINLCEPESRFQLLPRDPAIIFTSLCEQYHYDFPKSKRPGNSAVLANAPEMDGDQHRHDHRNKHAVQHIKTQQRVLAHEGAGQQE